MKFRFDKKARILTYDELNKMFEDALHEQGFMSDDQIKKMFEQYKWSKEHTWYFQNPFKRDPKNWQELKDILLEEFLAKDLDSKPINYNFYNGDEWEETDEDPVE